MTLLAAKRSRHRGGEGGAEKEQKVGVITTSRSRLPHSLVVRRLSGLTSLSSQLIGFV